MHAMCMRLRKKEKERTMQGEKANEKEDILRFIFVRFFRKIQSHKNQTYSFGFSGLMDVKQNRDKIVPDFPTAHIKLETSTENN